MSHQITHSVRGSQQTIESSSSHPLNYFLKSVQLLLECTLFPTPPPCVCAVLFVCVCSLLCSQGRFLSTWRCSPALPPAAGDRSVLWLPSPLPQVLVLLVSALLLHEWHSLAHRVVDDRRHQRAERWIQNNSCVPNFCTKYGKISSITSITKWGALFASSKRSNDKCGMMVTSHAQQTPYWWCSGRGVMTLASAS